MKRKTFDLILLTNNPDNRLIRFNGLSRAQCLAAAAEILARGVRGVSTRTGKERVITPRSQIAGVLIVPARA
jgi:hypothetical protein